MNVLSSSDDSDDEEILRNFDAEAKLIILTDTLPKKSADKYLSNHETYKKWLIEHRASLSNSDESNLIVYFKGLSEKLKPSTIWSTWSMLKKTLNNYDNIDIGRFQKLKSLVKNNCKGYRPKKSLVLKSDDVTKFLNDASDITHLDQKVILIFGICGALRCLEIYNLKRQEVEDLGNRYLVSVNDTKNDVPRQFIIGGLFYEIVKKYVLLRPKDLISENFFIQYRKGKCIHQNIGRNTIGATPQSIALFLDLPNTKRYTGHCFRRTAATLLSDSGASTTMLKQLGGWKSTAIAQGYVENSLKTRERIFNSITGTVDPKANNNSEPSTSSSNLTTTNDENLQHADIADPDFEDDFVLDTEDLTTIDSLNMPRKSTSPLPSTLKTTARTTTATTATKSTHFTRKLPINIFSKKDEPPEKKLKFNPLRNVTHEKKFNSALDADTPCNTFDNCTFNGNIINNFYCSCMPKNSDKCDKK
ncbi:uncharacterized protein LOC141528467 [Cotesia typhae]|uniref:uncharacterized protein LOC141528467 n=1 Tax=Cotesia typhae TaxID=2053667 RepID=UPI003D6888FE